MKNENKSNGSGVGKFIAGAALGVGLGILFAPKSGKETRKEISDKVKELVEKAKELDKEDIKNAITTKAKEIENEIRELDKETVLKIAKEKSKMIQKKADELYKMVVEKGTPVLEKTAKELKQNTADALKKIVEKLEA